MAAATNGHSHDHHPLVNGMCHLQPGSILCVGNALLDVSFFGDEQFIRQQGLNTNDAIVIEEVRYRKMQAELESKYFAADHVPGGACQNTARTAQWLLSDHPGTVTYMGSIGKDAVGAILTQKAQQAGVNGIYQEINDSTPTGCCLVILNGSQRSLAAFLGAAVKFSIDHVTSNWAAVERAKFIYIEGFFLSSCFEACMAFARHVAEHPEKRLLVNLSAEFVTTCHKHMLLEILPYADIVIGNDIEAHSFAKEMGFSTDVMEVVRSIANMEKKRPYPIRSVVITRGPKSVIFTEGGDSPVTTSEVVSLRSDQIVDTNGAGDAFVGGFLAQLISGRSLQECIRSGSNTAAIIIQRLGVTFPAEKPDLDRLCE